MNLLNLLYSTYGNYGNYSNYGMYDNPIKSPSTDWSQFSSIIGGIFAAIGVMLIFIIAIAVLMIIANWIIFKKMGLDGWKSLIPYVKEYLQMEKTGVDQKWLLVLLFGSLICFIPILGFLLFLIVLIYYVIIYNVSLARSFGKTDGFAVGLILLPFVFLCILAFGDSKYQGANPMNDVVFKRQASTINTENTEKKETKEVKTNKSFCPNCGEIVKPKDTFCTKCGKKVK